MSQTMTTYTVTAPCGVDNEFDDKSKALDGKDTHEALCDTCEKGDVDVVTNGEEETKEDTQRNQIESESEAKEAQPVMDTDGKPQKTSATHPEEVHKKAHSQALQKAQELARNNEMPDPNQTLPEWMLTEIQHGGDISVDLNKRGTQVVTNTLNLQVNAECEVEAQDTDYEYCRYRATAETPDGKTFNAVGDAHIDESGNDKWDLERLAETRAKKRAVKWASAGGIAAFEQSGENDEP